MNRTMLSGLLVGLVYGVATLASAQPALPAETASPLFTPRDAIAYAVKHHPDLAAALADLHGVQSRVEGEEHRYATVWGLEGGVTRTKNPTLGPVGTTVRTIVPHTDEVSISTDLRRRFSHGGNVGITVSAKRLTMRSYFGLPLQAYDLGPAYATSVKLDATQPLLRGFGNEVGEINLSQARAQAQHSVAAYHRITSEHLATVLRAYWELVYASQALEIQRQAIGLAEQQRDEARLRVNSGALADVELTSFESRVAQLESETGDAEVEVERRRIELERLCAFDTRGVRLDTPPERIFGDLPPYAELRGIARARSPSLRELKAALALAESQAKIAGDSLRPALDVNAYVQAQGLSYRDMGPAVTQVGELSALGVHVGLRYESSLDSTQRRMQAAEAGFAVSAAQKRVESAARQIDAALLKSFTESRASSRRVELAARAVELAERQHQAEKHLFESGSSTAIRVREAEEQVRSTRLKWLRARVDALGSEIEVDRITGRLGEAYLALGR